MHQFETTVWALCGVLLSASYEWVRRARSPYPILIYAFLNAHLVFSVRGGFLPEIFPLWALLILVAFGILFARPSPIRPQRRSMPAG